MRVLGWWKESRKAHKQMVCQAGEDGLFGLYLVSPMMGQPMWASCTRIWWRRPVSSLISNSVISVRARYSPQ
ncbi:hypothetical protein IMSAGC020_00682 [Lachnospiraceae bacterium]|nr:hypothetical protein IMSAGC020_00682 [Lachnospiraceae bacterium]